MLLKTNKTKNSYLANLAHESILVTIHASQLADVRKNVLQAVSQLVRVDVAETVLHVRIDNDLGEAQKFAHQVESIAETRLFALFRRQRLHRLQIEVVVEMQICQILLVNKQIQHVVALKC